MSLPANVECVLIFRFLNRVYIRPPQVRRRAQSVPARKPSESEEFKQKALLLSRSSARCPTCSGNPTISNPVICLFF